MFFLHILFQSFVHLLIFSIAYATYTFHSCNDSYIISYLNKAFLYATAGSSVISRKYTAWDMCSSVFEILTFLISWLLLICFPYFLPRLSFWTIDFLETFSKCDRNDGQKRVLFSIFSAWGWNVLPAWYCWGNPLFFFKKQNPLLFHKAWLCFPVFSIITHIFFFLLSTNFQNAYDLIMANTLYVFWEFHFFF